MRFRQSVYMIDDYPSIVRYRSLIRTREKKEIRESFVKIGYIRTAPCAIRTNGITFYVWGMNK